MSVILKNYINSLIDNIDKKNIPLQINLIIDGGAFTAAQTAGCLYYLKEMERLNIIKINKISGCSVGAILGYMYLTDSLEYIPLYYKILVEYARKKVKFKKIVKIIKNHVKKTDYTLVNNRLFISYNDINKLEHIVISEYKSKKEVTDYIVRSAFIPLVFNGELQYKDRYCDGLSPYLFNKSSNPTLFISLISLRDIKYTVYSKNDNDIWEKFFKGLDDIHLFFKNDMKSSKYCSFIEKWTFYDFLIFSLREIITFIIIILVKCSSYIDKNILLYIKNNIYYKRLTNIIVLLTKIMISYNIF